MKVLLLGLLVLFAYVATATNVLTFHHSPEQAARAGWAKSGKAHAEQEHTVVFAIKQKDNALATCDSLLMTVSDPRSPSYGQHLSLTEVGDLFANPTAAKKVYEWISTNVEAPSQLKTTVNSDFIILTASVQQLEQLLDAEFYHFKSQKADKVIIRASHYSLPAEIAQHVDFVGNTIRFPVISTKIRAFQGGANNGMVTPALINKYYGIDSNSVNNAKATMALFEALGQDFSPSDLTAFEALYSLPRIAVRTVIGPNNPNACQTNPDNCGEANLDVQYIIAVAQNSWTTFWSIDSSSNDPFLSWILAVAQMANPPLVHSISYGSISSEDDSKDVYRYNIEACKLGLRGLTIVVSSGDDGVANFIARNDQTQCGFNPSFPATSPYVTAVGATQGPESGSGEVACSSNTGGIITTGGGFSIYFPRPSYQKAQVAAYLRNAPGLPPLNLFNSTSRGYPDVAILGYNYNLIIAGQAVNESGTSASAPVFAGMVTLINNARLNANKKPLGFLNPALYQLPSGVFNDITVGENNCCAGWYPNIVCCQYGFNATAGWDPLTGLGSPKFSLFKKALLAL